MQCPRNSPILMTICRHCLIMPTRNQYSVRVMHFVRNWHSLMLTSKRLPNSRQPLGFPFAGLRVLLILKYWKSLRNQKLFSPNGGANHQNPILKLIALESQSCLTELKALRNHCNVQGSTSNTIAGILAERRIQA